MNKITSHTVLSRRTNIISSNLDTELVMMNVDRGMYYGLEEIGVQIWNMMEKPIRVADLVAQLNTRYQVESEQCEADTLEFLEELFAEDLIVIHS